MIRREPEHRPRRSCVRTVLFSLLTVAAGLLFLETGARWALSAVFGPQAVPQTLFRFSVPEKEPGAFRIFFFGGSTVYGGHLPKVGFVNQFRALLEACLPDRTVEVFNFGASGRDSTYVRRAVEATLEHEPDAIVVYTGHNEFLWPASGASRLRVALGYLDRTAAATLIRTCRDRWLPGLAREAKVWEPVPRGSARFAEAEAVFADNLESLARSARQAGVPLIVCTAASNLSRWPPVRRELTAAEPDERFAGLRDGAASALEAGDLDRARPLLDQLVSLYPEEAGTRYLQGRASEEAGDFAGARTHYLEARERDPVPLRALDAFNRRVRALAEQEGVYLADLEEVFRAASPHGLTGDSLMMDNCHPLPEGNYRMASALLDLFLANGWIGAAECSARGGRRVSLQDVMREVGFTEGDRQVLGRRNALYCGRAPFCNQEAVERSLREAGESAHVTASPGTAATR